MKISCSFSASRSPFVVSHHDQAALKQQQQIRFIKARGRRLAMTVCRVAASTTDDEYYKHGIDFYKLLSLGGGSESTITVRDIKRGYRRMALQYHPDVCEPSRKEESTRMFLLLHMAYKTLSDPVLRAEYDDGISRLKLKTRSSCSSSYWREQVEDLKIKRSTSRSTTDTSSWGTTMRARMHKH